MIFCVLLIWQFVTNFPCNDKWYCLIEGQGSLLLIRKFTISPQIFFFLNLAGWWKTSLLAINCPDLTIELWKDLFLFCCIDIILWVSTYSIFLFSTHHIYYYINQRIHHCIYICFTCNMWCADTWFWFKSKQKIPKKKKIGRKRAKNKEILLSFIKANILHYLSLGIYHIEASTSSR